MSMRRKSKKDSEEPEGPEPEVTDPEAGTTIETDWVTPEAEAPAEVAEAPVEPEPAPEPEATAEPEPAPEPEAAPEPEPEPAPEPESVFVPPLPIADEPYVSPFDDAGSSATPGGLAAERPEALVGAAFAGGVLAAMILRRLGR